MAARGVTDALDRDSPVSPETTDPACPTTPFEYGDTTIIFDWDDTLLSSSWLAQNDLRLESPEIPAETAALLDVLQDSVLALLERATRVGTVIVITNAETGWVELSCKKFMPRVFDVIGRLKVLSARSAFEGMWKEPTDWKTQAFFQELWCAYAGKRADAPKNVLSFGDSVHERSAVHSVTSTMGPSTRTKSIKFVERPTVEQLKRQVDLVCSCFEELVAYDGSLDLMLTISLLYQ